MSVVAMRPVILEGVDLVVQALKEKADLIGVEAENIYRTYNPEKEKDDLNPDGEPVIIVYVQKADAEEIEENSGITKTITLSAAMMARVGNESAEVIDPLTAIFENLQNALAITNLLKTADGQGYQITELETADFVNLEFLQESSVVMFRLDFNLKTTVEGDFETFTDATDIADESEEDNAENADNAEDVESVEQS